MSKKTLKQFAYDFPDLSDDILKLESLYNSDKIRITVFGKYNHGKTTLLNAIIGENVFGAGDIRTKNSVQKIFYNGIVWYDTPGLAADVSGLDYEESKDAINASDIIFLVHSIREGELDKDELGFIISALKDFPMNRNKFVLILSQIEQMNPNDLADIETAVFWQLCDMHCMVEIVKVSAHLYIKGKRENKAALEDMSNFSRLMQVIQRKKNQRTEARRSELFELKRKITSQLDKKTAFLESEINILLERKSDIMDDFTDDYRDAINGISFKFIYTELDEILTELEQSNDADKAMKMVRIREKKKKIKNAIELFEEKWQTGSKLSSRLDYIDIDFRFDYAFEEAFSEFIPKHVLDIDRQLRIKQERLSTIKEFKTRFLNLNT